MTDWVQVALVVGQLFAAQIVAMFATVLFLARARCNV